MSISAETNFSISNNRRDSGSQPIHALLMPKKHLKENHTLDDSDNGYVLVFHVGATLTVPSGLDTGFNCGIAAWGTGDVVLVGSGATVNNRSGFDRTAGQYALLFLISISSNEFLLTGDGA